MKDYIRYLIFTLAFARKVICDGRVVLAGVVTFDG